MPAASAVLPRNGPFMRWSVSKGTDTAAFVTLWRKSGSKTTVRLRTRKAQPRRVVRSRASSSALTPAAVRYPSTEPYPSAIIRKAASR